MLNKLIDCFKFFNELDLLEIRLNSLAPYVERFVLSECPVTQTGLPKPMYFAENRERFKDFNITHLVANDYEKYRDENAWIMEHYQRENLMNGIQNVDPETMILISDLDEIPDLESYDGVTEGVFRQRLYYYHLNTYTRTSNWKGTVAICRKNITTLTNLRNRRWKMNSIARGWHFSHLGSIEHIVNKITSCAHKEFNTPEVKERVPDNVKNLLDPYNRNTRKLSIGMPSGPKWLLDNKEKYEHLFYKESD